MSHSASPPLAPGSPPNADAIREELSRITESIGFADAERLRGFLRFVVEETLSGRGSRLKESVIGVEVFGRTPGYDSKADPIVRVQARRLRTKLDEYYVSSSSTGGVRIALPKGGYTPEFVDAVVPPPEIASIVPAATPTPAPRRRPKLVLILAAGMLVAAATLIWSTSRTHPDAQSLRVFTAYAGYQTDPAFSPDGNTVAFIWSGESDDYFNVYIQRLDADSPRRLTTARANASNPAWLPDGNHVAYLRPETPERRKVVVAPIQGGDEHVVAELGAAAQDRPTIQWSSDGKHLYASERPAADAPSHVVDIQLQSGARKVLSTPPAGSKGDDAVALSPDGKLLAFRRTSESAVQDVFTVAVDGGRERPITHDRSGVLGCAWMRNGRDLIVSSRRQNSLQSLWRVPIDGSQPARLTDPPEAASYPAVSPRDGQIAYAARFLDANIWRIDLDNSDSPRRLIASNLLESSPHYSYDGSRIAFRSNRTGNDELWTANANGESPIKLTSFGGPVTGNARWSPDGHTLAVDSRPFGTSDVFLVPSGGGQVRRFTSDASNEVLPSFSSDGKFVYFASDRTKSWQIWKQPAAGGEPRQVTRNGGFAPLESQDGKWVYFAKLEGGGLFRMPVEGGEETRIIDTLPPALWGGWGIIKDQIVYLTLTPGSANNAQVMVMSLDTRQTRVAATLPFPPVQWDGSLGVSPDGKYALVAETERAGSEIHLRYIH